MACSVKVFCLRHQKEQQHLPCQNLFARCFGMDQSLQQAHCNLRQLFSEVYGYFDLSKKWFKAFVLLYNRNVTDVFQRS